MQKETLPEVSGYLARKRRRQIWGKIVSGLACIVVFCTTYALILPAITLEKDTNDSAEASEELVCSLETLDIHAHSDSCYDDEDNLICGYADFIVHTHDSSCYDQDGNLVCTLPEIEAHTHTYDCYEEGEAAVIMEGHTHTEECYTAERGGLICEQEESEEHQHDDECYNQEQVLICGKEEQEAQYEELEPVLVCGQEESDEHTHSDSCYKLGAELICDKEEIILHTHTEECYAQVDDLICKLDESDSHQHSDECYAQEQVLICGKTEIKEHVHGEDCFVAVEQEETEGTETTADDNTVQGLSATADTNTATITATWEEGTLPANVSLIVSEYDEDDRNDLGKTLSESLEEGRALNDIYPYDISFLNEFGEEIEPRGTVNVTMTFKNPIQESGDNSAEWLLFHVTDDGGAEEIVDASVVYSEETDGIRMITGVTFQAEHFSAYVLASTTAAVIPIDPISGQYAIVNGSKKAAVLTSSNTAGKLAAQTVHLDEDESSGSYSVVVFSEDDVAKVQAWNFKAIGGSGESAPADPNQLSAGESGTYYVTAIVDGETRYLTINGTSVTLETQTDENRENQVITVKAGTGAYAGMFRLTNNSNYAVNLYGGEAKQGFGGYKQRNDTDNLDANEWFYLCNTVNNLSDRVEDAGTVEGISPSGTVINLFDYWLTGQDNPDFENTFNAGHFTAGINSGHALKFSCNRTRKNNQGTDGLWNVWTGSKNVYSGIVSNTLGGDGYPVLSGEQSVFTPDPSTLSNIEDGVSTSESLAYLFNPNEENDYKETHRNIKGLLQIDKEGYYYYNSQKNFAELNKGETNNGEKVTLYDQWGIRAGGSSPNGQFFPFNSFKEAGTFNSKNSSINHYFGMTLTTRFVQWYDGHTDASKKVKTVFEFSGDDDVWIFVDDVLVADLGGIHDRASVNINFATGDVTINGSVVTTLKAAFSAAGKEKSTEWNGNTFANDTYHTLKFYYLERGNTDSNLLLKYNLKDIPPTAIYKVDQYGEEVKGATFAVYAAEKATNPDGTFVYKYCKERNGEVIPLPDSYTFDKDGNIVDSGGDILVKALYTGTTDESGEMVFVDEDGMYYTLTELQRMFGSNFILREIAVPEGYRLVSDETYLRIVNNKILLCDNAYESGTWASSNLLVTAPDTLQRANSSGTINYYNPENGNINGMLFAVVLKYNGGISGDQTAESNWAPVYGTDMDGYNVIDLNEHNNDFIKAAIAAAKEQETIANKNEGEGSVVFKLSASGGMQTTLTNLPGDILYYYYMLDEDHKNETQYTVAYYWTSAGTLDGANNTNTFRVNSDLDDGNYSFNRTFGATIQVPNLTNRLFAQKLDENGTTLVNGATFALYEVEENNGNIYYIADDKDKSKVILNKGEYTIDSNGTIRSNNGDYTIIPIQVEETLAAKAKANPSGEDGTATFTNLLNGKYYLREIKAPEGYKLNETEVMVLVTDDAIYANAGSSQDGVTVARGPGYVVSTLEQFASQGQVDNTLSWVYERLLVSEVSSSFSTVLNDVKDGHIPSWSYLKANNDPDLTTETGALTNHLVYNVDSNNTLFNYTVNDEWYSENGIDPSTITRRLYTSVGWSYYLLYQDYVWGSEHFSTGANYENLEGQEISNLFSRSTYVQVTDQHMDSQLEIRKIVKNRVNDDTAGNTEFTFDVKLYKVETSTSTDETTGEEITTRNEIPLEGTYTYKVYDVTYDDNGDETKRETVKKDDGEELTGTITNGEGTVTLKASQLIMIEGLPAGTWYSVTEAWNSDYSTTAVRDKGKKLLNGSNGTIGTGDTSDSGDIRIEAGEKNYTFDTFTKAERTVVGTLYWNIDEEGEFDGTSTVAYTNTYLPDLTIQKYQSGDPKITLDGAEFVFYHTVTTDESSSCNYYYHEGNWKTLSEDEAAENPITEDTVKLTSKDGGKIILQNIPDGEYILKELKAPPGYNLLKEPITVVVTGGKITGTTQGVNISEDKLTLNVPNSTGYELPSTGGFGRTPYTMAGLLLMCSAAGLWYGNKKHNFSESQ